MRIIDNFRTHYEIDLWFFEGGLLHNLGERLTGSQEVRGSIPLISTKIPVNPCGWREFSMSNAHMDVQTI